MTLPTCTTLPPNVECRENTFRVNTYVSQELICFKDAASTSVKPTNCSREQNGRTHKNGFGRDLVHFRVSISTFSRYMR